MNIVQSTQTNIIKTIKIKPKCSKTRRQGDPGNDRPLLRNKKQTMPLIVTEGNALILTIDWRDNSTTVPTFTAQLT